METRTNKKTSIPLKDVAMQLMRQLDMPMSSILLFEQRNLVTIFDFDGDSRGYAFPCTDLYDKIIELEERYNIMIYAVTRDYLAPIGEMYSFLCVSSYEEDWDHMVQRVGTKQYMVYAYVQNVQDDLCSEFGNVALSMLDGKIKRVG